MNTGTFYFSEQVESPVLYSRGALRFPSMGQLFNTIQQMAAEEK